jgi:hypothetical protein
MFMDGLEARIQTLLSALLLKVSSPFTNLIPRVPASFSSEGSPLSPARESGNIFHAWKREQGLSNKTAALANSTAQLQRQLSRIRNPLRSSFATGMHPFKIFQYPAVFRVSASSYDVETEARMKPKQWRTFRVRGGLLITQSATGVTVLNTDYSEYPYDEITPRYIDGTEVTGVKDVVVPVDTEFFLFWIEVSASGTTANLRWHSTPSSQSYTDNETPAHDASWSTTTELKWTVFPTIDSQHIPIGYVNTKVLASEYIAPVRQFVVSDIMGVAASSASCPYA